MEKKKFALEYKWIIVSASFLMVFVCLGFCSSNKSLYLSAITEALGIKRSVFSINDSCRFLATAVVNLFFGYFVNRFGIKKMIGVGFASLITSVLIYAYATNVFVFYLGGCFLGIGLAFTTTTMVGCVVNRWCKEHTGKIMGLVLAANGLGGALAAQIVSPIIYQEGNLFGYRSAYKLVALILLVVGILVLLVFREKPADGTVEAYKHKKKARGAGWIGISYQTAISKPYFYLAGACVFLTGIVLQGINGVAAAHMKDVGLDAEYVAMVLSFHSLALAAFKFLTGVIYDRFGVRKTMLICETAAVSVTFLLAIVSPSPVGKIIALIYGVFSSLALPLETVMIPLFTSDLFGNMAFDKLLGIFVSLNTAGFAVGTPLINWYYDMAGTYTPMLFAFSALMLAVSVTFQIVLIFAQKDKAAVMAAYQ